MPLPEIKSVFMAMYYLVGKLNEDTVYLKEIATQVFRETLTQSNICIPKVNYLYMKAQGRKDSSVSIYAMAIFTLSVFYFR